MPETTKTIAASPYRQVREALMDARARRIYASDLEGHKGTLELWSLRGRTVVMWVWKDLGIEVYRPVQQSNDIAEEIAATLAYLKGEQKEEA